MHDIDRVRLEAEADGEAFGAGEFEGEQFEFNVTGEVFGEAEAMELASELLEVANEAEMEQFLGDVVARAGRALGQFVASAEGQNLVGALKGAARQVLPQAGSAIGRYFGGTTGAKLGSQIANLAGHTLGLELEGLSGEDREFEIAKRFVNFAGEAVRHLVNAEGRVDPRLAVKTALAAAAETHVPGLLQRVAGQRPARPGPARNGDPAPSGRWVRHGSKIFLYGA
ncbi:hypothetical protein [Methylobacterium sp. PvR107]|uniref:hypothetical protein n=1 Tax=Methylobacterium sp. PvR107 TaxID=2806597 RepID=UPI001AE7FF9C|nr:hypothetical protein [Methylobacterium sp. PvR107]MBP1181625.1 hypothetical protein [Methylobacterium sp. PvR107]